MLMLGLLKDLNWKVLDQYRSTMIVNFLFYEFWKNFSSSMPSKKDIRYQVWCFSQKVAGTKAKFRERSNKHKLIWDSDFNNQTRPPSFTGQRFDNLTLTDSSSLDFDLVAFLVQFYADKKSHKDILVNGNNKTDFVSSPESYGSENEWPLQ